MRHLWFILTRLWRYQSLYFLKPNDAVNDTLTSSLLCRLDWTGPIVEIGSGDGVFSYIMHGGAFPLDFDRYLLTDLSKQDIYDDHRDDVIHPAVRLDYPNITLAIDAKQSHVDKIAEIGFAKQAKLASYESLPLASSSVAKVFYYTPHGLNNHEEAIREAARIVAPGGSMLILLFDSKIKSSFICHRLAGFLPGAAGRYFSRLDNGRHDEIMSLAKSPLQWENYFSNHRFVVEKKYSGLSTFAWKVYDTQTRAILKILIRIFGSLPRPLRTWVKTICLISSYPYLVFFYLLFSNEYLRIDPVNCYVAYQLKKIDQP